MGKREEPGIGPSEAKGDVRATALALLSSRAPGATICPSEVARAIASGGGHADWRTGMPAVHEAIDAMAAEGLVRLTWKGEAMAAREGPYRIGRRIRG
jgi:uncharacterized protein DUF3253